MGLGLLSPTALKVPEWRSNSPRGVCVPLVPHGRRPDAGSGVPGRGFRVGGSGSGVPGWRPGASLIRTAFLFVSGRATASFLPSDNGEFRKRQLTT
jgi:hypothetical protein